MELLFLYGILIGFVASFSFGPVAFAIFQKTANNGGLRGVISSLGAASADSIIAIIAVFSMSSFFGFFQSYQIPIRFVGGLMVIALGLKIILTNFNLQERKQKINLGSVSTDFFSSFLIILFNPLTLFMYTMLFTTFHIVTKEINIIDLVELILGVFLGANLWWSLIVILSKNIHKKVHLPNMKFLNKIIGSIVIISGLFILISIINLNF
jgi:threonine/homoserine/homoserine lactone efflux protein